MLEASSFCLLAWLVETMVCAAAVSVGNTMPD